MPATVTVFAAGLPANPPPVMVAVMPRPEHRRLDRRNGRPGQRLRIHREQRAARALDRGLRALLAGLDAEHPDSLGAAVLAARAAGDRAIARKDRPEATATPGMGSPRLSVTRTARDTLAPAVAEIGLAVAGLDRGWRAGLAGVVATAGNAEKEKGCKRMEYDAGR